MLLNFFSRLVVCQAALSSTITACVPSGIFSEMCSRLPYSQLALQDLPLHLFQDRQLQIHRHIQIAVGVAVSCSNSELISPACARNKAILPIFIFGSS
jgi:hypothetical protein